MKKIFTYPLLALGMLVTQPIFADTTPVELFSFTVDSKAVGEAMTILLSATDGQKASIDWGDGKLVEIDKPLGDDKNWTGFDTEGKIAGTTIKVYGQNPATINVIDLSKETNDGANAFVETVNISKLTGLLTLHASNNHISTVDLTGLLALETLTLTNNTLSSLKLPGTGNNLTYLRIGNTVNVTTGEKTAGNNTLINLNYGDLPNLTTLELVGIKASFGFLGSFKISGCTKLKTLNVNGCGFTDNQFSVVGQLTALTTLNAQWNNLTNVDLSKIGSGAYIYLNHNALTSIKLPAGAKRVNIPYNNFVFSTLPPLNCASNYLYAPQADIALPLDSKNISDLSSVASVGDVASVYKFTAEENGTTITLTEADNQYRVNSPGVFQFLIPVKNLQAKITNAAFPALTLSTGKATSVGLLPTLSTITLDSSTVGLPMTLEIGSAAESGQSVYVDWGDGEPQGPYAVGYLSNPDSYASEITTTKTLGNTVVIKGEPSTICTFIANGSRKSAVNGEFTSSAIKNINVSAMTNLYKLSLNVNALSQIDLSANTQLGILNLQSNSLKGMNFNLPKLVTLNVSNYNSGATKYYGDNEFPTLDISNLPLLTSLDASFTGCQFDFTQGANLKTITMRGNGMKSADFSKLAASPTVYLNWNEFETADLSVVPSKAKFYFVLNKLTSIKGNKDLALLNVSNNALTFATLPSLEEGGASYTYSPQADMPVECNNGVVDLSSQAEVGGVATVYKWAAGANAFEDYTVANGVFSFTKAATGLVCTMTNTALPKLTLKTVAMDVTANPSIVDELDSDNAEQVEYFNLQGVKVSGNEPGLYIRKVGNKVTKVLVK